MIKRMKTMNDTLEQLYQVILSRRSSGEEGSYTAYLFREGLDKILKKCGEESAEVIIAAKAMEALEGWGARSDGADSPVGGSETFACREALKEEVCDLIYHLLVLLAEREIPLSEIKDKLDERSMKTGNLKKKHESDPNS